MSERRDGFIQGYRDYFEELIETATDLDWTMSLRGGSRDASEEFSEGYEDGLAAARDNAVSSLIMDKESAEREADEDGALEEEED